MTDPGPAPTPLVFPETEARSLNAAIERLLATLDRALEIHRKAHASDLGSLLGPERERFDADLRTRLTRLHQHRRELAAQRSQVRDAIAVAEVQVAERAAARHRWERDLRGFRAAQEIGR